MNTLQLRQGLNKKEENLATYTQIIYQLVFSTKNRECTLTPELRPELYKYIWGILKNKKCHLYRIGGVSDHVHIITHIHPTVAVAPLIKDIKIASSQYIKTITPDSKFTHWQIGYGAFTYSIKDKDRLIEYVKNQENHHRKKTFQAELVKLLHEHGIEFDEKYLL